MKFKPVQEKKTNDTFKTMKVGQVARVIANNAYHGYIIVRSYMGWVSLNNPNKDWDYHGDSDANPTMEVEIFPVGVDFTFTTDV